MATAMMKGMRIGRMDGGLDVGIPVLQCNQTGFRVTATSQVRRVRTFAVSGVVLLAGVEVGAVGVDVLTC